MEERNSPAQETDVGDSIQCVFRIYGDNIDECLQLSGLLAEHAGTFGLKAVGEYLPLSAPLTVYQATPSSPIATGTKVATQLCGRYGEWHDERRPYLGYELADAAVTCAGNPDKLGDPVVGLEFNSAIPAGNNAWQRFPRVAQAANREVPFLYSIPVCDAEVKDEELKSIRHPNTVFSVGQTILMAENQTTSLTVYRESPWYETGLDAETIYPGLDGTDGDARIAKFVWGHCLKRLASDSFNGVVDDLTPLSEALEQLFLDTFKDMLAAISFYASSDFTLLEEEETLSPDKANEFSEEMWEVVSEGRSLQEKYKFYNWQEADLKNGYRFSKATSTPSTFRDCLKPKMCLLTSWRKDKLVSFAESWGVAVPDDWTKRELLNTLDKADEAWRHPLSYKNPTNELAFVFSNDRLSEILQECYPNLQEAVWERLEQADLPTLFIPIAGYVQDTGGIAFSRPDKGFLGLARTLFEHSDSIGEVVVLMYHPEIPRNWRQQLQRAVAERGGDQVEVDPNNLWRETVRLASIVVIDCHEEAWVNG